MSTQDLPVISVEDSAALDTPLEAEAVRQLAAPGQAHSVDDSMVQPGVQLHELPPPLEGVLTPIEFIGWGGYSE
ncbi:hypothetical protein FRC01_005262, partial [Tulasnella sp. 417]